MIRYLERTDEIRPEQLQGFFGGWPDPPSPATHLRLLEGSQERVLALDEESGRVVGFVTALSDGVLAACLPLLEVLPEWRGRGIGAELVRRVLTRLGELYMIDLVCDPDLQPFYQGLGFTRAIAMVRRSYARQPGRAEAD